MRFSMAKEYETLFPLQWCWFHTYSTYKRKTWWHHELLVQGDLQQEGIGRCSSQSIMTIIRLPLCNVKPVQTANHSSLLPRFSHWLFPVRPWIIFSKTGVRSIRVFSVSMISSWSLAPSMNSSRVSSPAGSEVRIHNLINKMPLKHNTDQNVEKLHISYKVGSRLGCRSDLQQFVY